MLNDYKTIKISEARIGDEIIAIHPDEHTTKMGPHYTINKKRKNTVEAVNSWTNEIETFNSDIMVDIELTEFERNTKYFEEAKNVVEAMSHELYDEGDAFHEMWNGWIDCNPYDMAANAKEEQITIIGWFKLRRPKGDLDIGIVAEYPDGDRFWDHASSEWFTNWRKWYPELYN